MIFKSVSFRLFALVVVLGFAMVFAPVNDAMAVYYHPWLDKAHVDGNVVANSGSWTYTYTLFNDSYEATGAPPAPMPVIVSWDLPWFGDANITNIISPIGWNYKIETIGTQDTSFGWDGTAVWQNPTNPLYQGPTSPYTVVTTVLHWYTDPTGSQDVQTLADDNAVFPVSYGLGISQLTGFIFTSSYGSTGSSGGAPDVTTFIGLWHWPGDPDYPLLVVPASPDTLGATSAPEPATMLLLGLGLIGLIGVRRKIKK